MRLLALALLARIAAFGQIPLAFEPDGANFRTRDFAVSAAGVVTAANGHVAFEGARAAELEPLDRLPGVTNIYRGNPPQWRTGIPNYARLIARAVYPGIDVVYYANGPNLEFDFLVSPGADPRAIQLAYSGAESIRVDDKGDLVLTTSGAELRQHKPRAYQQITGRRVEVAASYRLANGRATFDLGEYDRSLALVIDPVLTATSYLDKDSRDTPVAIAADSTGVYVAQNSGDDAFVLKFSPDGKSLLYTTRLAGSARDRISGMVLWTSGNIFVTGFTESSDFPLRNEIPNTTPGRFTARLDPSGAIVYSTLAGGDCIAVDSGGSAYVAGGEKVLRIGPIGLTALFTTTVPNSTISACAVDKSGLYLAGTTPGRPFYHERDAFVTKISIDGIQTLYRTVLTASADDYATAIGIDADGNAYAGGATLSEDFPVQDTLFRFGDLNPRTARLVGFVAKLDVRGACVFSTLLPEPVTAIAVDPRGRTTVGGSTAQASFPTQSAALAVKPGATSGFAMRLDPSKKVIDYSTFVGPQGVDSSVAAIALDPSGATWVSGAGIRFARLDEGPAPAPVTITSNPTGRQVLVDGRAVTTPFTINWVPGTSHGLDVVSPQTDGTQEYRFASWRHGGNAAQTIVSAGSAQTYAVDFASVPCAFTVRPSNITVPSEGSSFPAEVNGLAGCQWRLTFGASWIEPQPDFYSRNFQSFGVAVQPNLGPEPRSGMVTAGSGTLTVLQRGVSASLSEPKISFPAGASGAATDLPGVAFEWEPVPGATAYEMWNTGGGMFRGIQRGTSILADLPGANDFRVRACDESACGPAASASFANAQTRLPSPKIIFPSDFDQIRSSPQVFRWTPVSGATSYRVWLHTPRYIYCGPGSCPPVLTELQTLTTETSITHFMQGLRSDFGGFEFEVQACTTSCNNFAASVRFTHRPAPTPSVAPAVTPAELSGNSFRFNWTAVNQADRYRVRVFPRGGSVPIASVMTTATEATLMLSTGPASALVAACNGSGCGPDSPPAAVNPTGPNPTSPVLGQPMANGTVDGPKVTFSWSRIPGDDGTNTKYRLFVQDFLRNSPALDVVTTTTSFTAQLAGEGRHYGALVTANPGDGESAGPAISFIVLGDNALAPNVVVPRNEGTVNQGQVEIAWSEVEIGPYRRERERATYRYLITRASDDTPVAEGITTGIRVLVPLTAKEGGTRYRVQVRACTDDTCNLESGTSTGIWSDPHIFTVVP
ncbi:MAG: hypothetical protein U0Q16_26135 [Bryobacteraceae bacterium]